MKKKVTKGHYGYIDSRKRSLLLRAVILSAGVAGLVITGIIATGSNKNWLTIVGAVTAIPAAMHFATYFAVKKYGSRPREEYERIAAITGAGLLNTELLIANREGANFDIAYAFVHTEGIFCYTPDLKMDLHKTTEYIRNYLRLNEVDGEVHIVNDLRTYEKQLKRLAPEDRATVDDFYLKQEGVLRAISV